MVVTLLACYYISKLPYYDIQHYNIRRGGQLKADLNIDLFSALKLYFLWKNPHLISYVFIFCRKHII
jgi:hypothetical protein